MQDLTVALAMIAFTFFVAGLVKGVIGVGLPAVAMGMLGLVMPPVQAAALLVVPSLVTNIWQLVTGPRLIGLFKRFATMMAGVCLGTALGPGLLTGGTNTLAAAALGGVLAAYGIMGLVSVRSSVSARAERWLSSLIGLITGVLTGATGVFVVPAVPYLNSLRLEKEELIQTLGLPFTASTVALAIGLAASGQFQASVAGLSFLALLPTLVGMFVGQSILTRLHPDTFRRWFFVALLLLGVCMLVRALSSAYARQAFERTRGGLVDLLAKRIQSLRSSSIAMAHDIAKTTLMRAFRVVQRRAWIRPLSVGPRAI